MASNSNRGVVYLNPGSVEVQSIDFPTFRNPAGKTIDHGVILKVVTTNICGSDQHMVRGRTTAPPGLVNARTDSVYDPAASSLTWPIVTGTSLPRLKTCPIALGVSATLTRASTTSAT